MQIIGAATYPDEYTRIDAFSLPVGKIAAGSDIQIKVPVGLIWNVVSLTALFTASAGAASRIPSFQIKDEGGTVVYTYATGTLTAAQTSTYTWSEDVSAIPTLANGSSLLWPMPNAWLPSSWTFGTSTAAIQAADQWSNIACYVQAYLPEPGE